MASGAGKSVAFALLVLNLVLFTIATCIAAWAINHGIEKARQTASLLTIPARIFPIYFPFGNMATGFFVIYSLIAGVVGFITSITGITNVIQWTSANLHAASASSLASWLLTLLAMGLACKEIQQGRTDYTLRSLEAIIIILSATQLLCVGAIHAGVENVVARQRSY